MLNRLWMVRAMLALMALAVVPGVFGVPTSVSAGTIETNSDSRNLLLQTGAGPETELLNAETLEAPQRLAQINRAPQQRQQELFQQQQQMQQRQLQDFRQQQQWQQQQMRLQQQQQQIRLQQQQQQPQPLQQRYFLENYRRPLYDR